MSGPGLNYYGSEEEHLVLEAIRSREMSRYRFDDEIGGKSRTYEFEREAETWLGVEYCLGMNSCTAALYCSMRALGIGPGDEVLVPGYTFIASIAAIAYVGATPVLCEIDDSLTLDPNDVCRQISSRTRAVLAVHMLGAPCNMGEICEIAERHGLLVIEDVAQAFGGSFQGKKLGAHGDTAAFSLNVFKTITAGDGGLLATSDEEVFRRAFAIHDHGAKPFRGGVVNADALLGMNLRMHEMTGAVALAQIRKLDDIVDQVRGQKRLFLSSIGTVAHARSRRINDPDGECGTMIVWLLDSAEQAQCLARALQTHALIDSGNHYYGNMKQLLSPQAWPQECVPDNLGQRYGIGRLPQTDDILSRSIALSVGVSDSYLGAGFGINVDSSRDEIDRVSQEFNRLAAEALA